MLRRIAWANTPLFVVILALVGLAPAAAATTPAPATAEMQFLSLLNQARVDDGVAPLPLDPALSSVARAWSTKLADDGRLSHRGDLDVQAARVDPAWRGAGENVGLGGDVIGLHNAFMHSPAHAENVLNRRWNRVGVGVVLKGSTIFVTVNFLEGTAITGLTGLESGGTPDGDVWLTTADGTVYAFGRARNFGSLTGTKLNRPIVGMAPTPSGLGYWLVASDGGIFAFGDAAFYGSTGGLKLNRPIVGMAPTPSGLGYWLVASDGGIFAYGDAAFYGSTGGLSLNRPIVGMSPTADGAGYWLVASDGGVFAYGDARFFGSLGASAPPAGVNGIAVTPDGSGYWMVDADGAVYAFGSADWFGSASAAGTALTRIATMPDGRGYRMAAADGRVFSFGSAGTGVSAPLAPAQPVVAMANLPTPA